MLDPDKHVDSHAASANGHIDRAHYRANGQALERQQADLLSRLHTLIQALGRTDTYFGVTPHPGEVMQALGKELRRLGLLCGIALAEGDAGPLTLRYISLEPKTLLIVEDVLGTQLRGLRVACERLVLYDPHANGQHAAQTTDWLAAFAALLPGIPESALEQVGWRIEITVDTRAVCLPMRLGEWLQGVMCVWGGDLQESDLPALALFASQTALALENARLVEQVRTLRGRLQYLVRQLVAAQEEERQRVSRELHDEAGQALTALKISLDLMQADVPPGFATFELKLGEASALVERTLKQIHFLTQDLRPPILDAIGLNRTLESYCQDFAQRTGLCILYHGIELEDVPGMVSIAFYRFLQEALTNVVKHAHAMRVQVGLNCDAETLCLTVEDDGRGFSPDTQMPISDRPSNLGLLGMRERFELLGGQLAVDSQPGRGTRLAASASISEVP